MKIIAPFRKKINNHTLMKSFALYILTALLTICFVTSIFGNTLEPLHEPAEINIASQQEKALANKFILLVKQNYKIVSDPVVNTYINTLGLKLASHSPSPTRHFYFFIVNNSGINAFSGPDGYIGIFSGLMLKTKTEGELASVIAHEIAHTTQNHIMRAMEKQKTLQLTSLGAMLAAVIVGSQNPKAGAGIAQTATAGGYQSMLNFSREFEEEADRIGIQILTRAGFNPQAMLSFLNRLSNATPTNPMEGLELLQSHPFMTSRLADLSYRETKNKTDSHITEYPLIKARLQADVSHKPQGSCTNKNTLATCYLYASSLLKVNQAKQANKIINRLIQKDPNQLLFQMTKADIEHALGNDKKAIALLNKQYQYNPDYYPLVIQYANTLLVNQQPKKALTILDAQKDLFEQDSQYLYLLSKAQGESDLKAEAYQTRAQIYLLREDKKHAAEQLKMAIQFAKSSFTRKQIQTKLKQITSKG